MADDLKWAEHIGKAVGGVNRQIKQLTKERDELREALGGACNSLQLVADFGTGHMQSGAKIRLERARKLLDKIAAKD